MKCRLGEVKWLCANYSLFRQEISVTVHLDPCTTCTMHSVRLTAVGHDWQPLAFVSGDWLPAKLHSMLQCISAILHCHLCGFCIVGVRSTVSTVSR